MRLAGHTRRARPVPGVDSEADNAPRRMSRKAKARILAGCGAAALAFIGAVVAYYVNGLFGLFSPDYDFKVNVDPDTISTTSGFVGGAYVFPSAIEEVPAPPEESNTCVGRYRWAHENGAVDGQQSAAQVRISAGDKDLLITDLRPTVDDRATPLPGAFVTCPGRGEAPSRKTVSIDLDQDPPVVQAYDEEGAPIALDELVTSGSSVTFDIFAATNTCNCEWSAELVFEVDGERVTESVQVGGQRFRTTASTAAKAYERDGGRWVEQPSIGTPPPPGARIPPPAPACDAVSTPLLRELLGSSYTEDGNRQATPTNGVVVPIALSTCTWVGGSSGSAPGQLPTLTVMLQATEDESSAESEFEAEVDAYPQHGGPALRPVEGLADSAAEAEDVLLLRKGRVVINIQTSSVSGSTAELLRRVGEYAANHSD